MGEEINYKERDRKIAEMRKSGMKLKEIGDAFGLSEEHIRQICEKRKKT